MSESESEISTGPMQQRAAIAQDAWTPGAAYAPEANAAPTANGGVRWQPWEDAVIAEHYGHMQVAQIRRRFLPQRSIAGICARAERLGVTGAPRNVWSKEEQQRLQEFYGRMPVSHLIHDHLPGRSKSAIHTRAYALGLTSRASAAWSNEELALLREHYGTMSVPALQRRHLPHRTRAAIATQARLIGRSQPAAAPWTAHEDQLLRDHYPSMAIPAIRARHLPHRSCEAVRGRADVLGLRKYPRIGPWSDEQIELLRREFPKSGGVLRLCEHFRCSGNTIRSKARELGLSGPRGKQWSDSELAALRVLYPETHQRADAVAERTRAALSAIESDAGAECVG